MSTTKQIRYFHYLANRQGMSDEDKKTLIHGVSNGRSTSLKDLDRVEIVHAINALKGDHNTTMMMKIIAQAHEMGWEKAGGGADMDRINAWAIKHTPYHKPLDALTYEQMTKVVTLFGKVYMSYLKSL